MSLRCYGWTVFCDVKLMMLKYKKVLYFFVQYCYNQTIMSTPKRKIKIKDGTLGDMITYLRAEASTGERGSVGVNAARIIAIRVFRTVYGICWQDVQIADINIDELFEKFRQATNSKGYSIDTFETYYRRLRRGFDIYNMKDRKIEAIRITTREFEDEIQRLMGNINLAEEAFSAITKRYLFTDEAKNDYNVHIVHIAGMKPVALALPKEIDAINADALVGLLNRTCSCINTRQRRGMI